MNVRFAEECREEPLKLEPIEDVILRRAIDDGRTSKQLALDCDRDLYIGIFFDGTNNNKYRDTPGKSHSNVARLYEAFPARRRHPSAGRTIMHSFRAGVPAC